MPAGSITPSRTRRIPTWTGFTCLFRGLTFSPTPGTHILQWMRVVERFLFFETRLDLGHDRGRRIFLARLAAGQLFPGDPGSFGGFGRYGDGLIHHGTHHSDTIVSDRRIPPARIIGRRDVRIQLVSGRRLGMGFLAISALLRGQHGGRRGPDSRRGPRRSWGIWRPL